MMSKDQAPAMEIFTVELLKYFDAPPVKVEMNPHPRVRLDDETEKAVSSWAETAETAEGSASKRDRGSKESRRVSIKSQLDTVPEETHAEAEEGAGVQEAVNYNNTPHDAANADTERQPFPRAPSSLGFAPVSTSDYPYRWLLTVPFPDMTSDNDGWITTVDEVKWEEKRQQAYEVMNLKKRRRRMPRMPRREESTSSNIRGDVGASSSTAVAP